MAQRPVASVPLALRCCLVAALLLQLAWHATLPAPLARAQDLAPAPSLAALRIASLGEPIALSKVLTLYLQSHDDQAGLSIAWRALDYARVAGWLADALELDPRAQYPLLAASEVYAAVNDAARTRLMLEFVYARFGEDPQRRWPWLAHAAVIAKHRLHDLPLARTYARAIRLQARGPQVPPWARELEGFILEDMNELDSAKIVVGGLITGGQISDAHELQFLAQRLQQIEARQKRAAPACKGAALAC